MFSLPRLLSFKALLVAVIALVVLKRVHYELTTGARRRRMIKEHGCQPAWPYPHKGILGKTLGIDLIKDIVKAGREERPNQAARERFYMNGRNTVKFHLLRTQFIHTTEPEILKTILSTSFKDYSLGPRRARIFIPVFGHGIFDTDGAAWERSRAMIRPNFIRSQVADLDTFETHISHLIDAIPPDGSTVDLQDLFFSLTMDSATEFLFGKSTNTLTPGLGTKATSEFAKAFVYATKSMAIEAQSSGLSRWIPDRRRAESIKTMHKFADDYVAEAIARHNNPTVGREKNEKPERYVFLHALVSQTQDPYVLRSELLNVLLAGRDTTAGLLANTWWVLARRPDIWNKLLTEINHHCPGGKRPDYTIIKEMKYLKYVLNESLRLMPVVPSNSRYAERDNVLPVGGGPDGRAPLFVAAGTNVGYSVWSMHRRKDFYGEDADEFKPERWEHLRPGWEYLPFNGGPRICLGQQFALMEASYATIRLMQRFPRCEPRDPRPWSEWITMTLASGPGTKVALFEQ